MSIFQPSNIIPSSFSGLGNGVVDVNDAIAISWQVNGTSPLTGYSVAFYENDADSTFIDSIGANLTTPFYGVDRFGNPVIFQVYGQTPSENVPTWSEFYLVNGKSYKMVITQRWGANNENSVVQISPSVFLTRSKPTVEFDDFPSSVSSVSQDFSATYTQAEGDGINWSRWQLRRVASNGTYETIEDTGEIATSNLTYSYDGLVSGYSYQLSLTVETQSGMQATTGFMAFSVSYDIDETYQLPVQLVADSSMLLRFFDLDGSASPTAGYGNFLGSSLALARNASVTWSSRQGQALSITGQYQVVWRGNATAFAKSYLENDSTDHLDVVRSFGNMVFTGGYYGSELIQNPIINIYRENFGTLQRSQRIELSQIDPAFSTNTGVNDIHISPNGSTLLVCGGSSIAVFAIDGGGIVFKQHLSPSLSAARSAFNTVYALGFLDDQTFIAVGEFGAFKYVYNGNTWERGAVITDVNSRSLAVSPSKNYFAVGYTSQEGAMVSVFSKNGATIGIITPSLSSYNYSCNCLEFFGESSLAISGFYYSSDYSTFETLRSIYSISTSSITKVSDIPMPSGADTRSAISISYCPAQDTFVVSYNNGNATVYQGINTPTYLYSLSLPSAGQSFDFSDNYGMFFAVGRGFFYAYRFESTCNFLELATDGNVDQVDNILFQRTASTIGVYGQLGSISGSFSILGEEVVLSLTNNALEAWFFQNGEQVANQSVPLSYSQPEINSISLYGASTTEYVVVKNDDIIPFNLSQPTQIDGATYFLTDFADQTLIAIGYPVASTSLKGTLFSVRNGKMKRLVSLSTDVTNIKDFSAASGESREYVLLYSMQTSNRYYSSSSVCARWNAYYLIEAKQDSTDPTVFHALNVWKFGNNISQNAISNNNSPAWQTNFTPYRLRQPSSRMGKSGTLTALLSNVKDQRYSDSAALMETLFSASQSQNVFFLKDMKGNLFMVQISGPITQTINTKSCVQQVTVSIPWEEVGDASKVSLIQTSVDNGFTIGDSSQNI